MEYKITKTDINKIALSEDRKSVSVDISIEAQGTEGKVSIPIHAGTTIVVPLSLGEDIPDYIDSEIQDWFTTQYPGS